MSMERMIEDQWYKKLLSFEKLPEMTSVSEFEKKLHELLEKQSPVLYSLLNANFITLLSLETKEEENQSFQLFENGQLASYSNLLMLYNNKILANAKRRLPFYYSIPVISWIISFFKRKKNKKTIPESHKIIEEKTGTTQKVEKTLSRQEEISGKAKEISGEIIPEGSTIDRELNYLIKQWNRMISKEAYKNLIEDVNSLIRDYTRRILHTLSAKTFTRERIENLAKSLVNTPNMQKIPEEKALTEYVTLYMLRLLTNLK